MNIETSPHTRRVYEYWSEILDPDAARELAAAAYTNNAEYQRLKRAHRIGRYAPPQFSWVRWRNRRRRRKVVTL